MMEQAFLARFRSDREAGREVGLAVYLGQFPGHEEVVAREYLRVVAELRRGEGGGKGGRPGGNRLGPYRMIKELGRGGQGVVWLAEDARLGRKVALKVLKGLGPDAERHLARFRREAELASKLEHPCICGVHDTGIEGGVPYIAMRYVEGETLAEKLSRVNSAGTVPDFHSIVTMDDSADVSPKDAPASTPTRSLDRAELGRTIAVFEQAANALHAAHEVGIVHRDIKPGNLMIGKDGHPVLLDFGVARDDSDEAGPSLTQTGDLFGTPAYMSPEQITGRRVRLDRRSDIYSLGVTLYECLTLKRPFEAPTREALYQAILSKEAQPARRLNRRISTDLEVVLQCAMEKDRDKRYQTAADFAEDLRRVRSGEPILAKKISILGRAWRWSKRRPAAAALLGVLFLGIPTISGLGVWYWTHLDDVRAQEHAQLLEAVEDQLEVGFFELHHGSPETALAAFERGLAIDAASVESAVGLALSHEKLGNPQAALTVLERAEAAITSPGVLIPVKADLLRILGKDAQADALQSELRRPESALGWFIAGTRAMERGHYFGVETPNGAAAFTKAEGYLHRAVLANSRPRRAYHFELAHARAHCKCGGAIEVADALESLWPHSAESWHWSGFVTHSLDTQRSIVAYREAIRLKPDLTEVYHKLGPALEKQGRLEEAVAVTREAIRRMPRFAILHSNLGRVLAEQGKLDEAVVALLEAIRLKPDLAVAHHVLGNALMKQGKPKEALAAFGKAIDLNADDAALHFNLGASLDQLGNWEAAVTAYRNAIQLRPDFVEAHLNLGIIASRQGRLDDSVAAFREVIRLRPKLAHAHYNLGVDLGRQGDVEGAVLAYREAIRLKPDFSEPIVNLGIIVGQQGNWEEAVAAYREAIRVKPENATAHVQLGFALAHQGKFEEAVVAYREAIRLKPDFVEAHFHLGIALGQLGSHEGAVEAYRETIRLKPNSADVHYNLGIALGQLGNLQGAVVAYREAIRLNPSLAEAHCNLGIVLGQQGNLEGAVASYREAIRLKPDLALAHFRLGWVLSQQGNLEEAVAAYRETIRLKPDFAEAHVQIGIIAGQQGKSGEALEAFREAIRHNPELVEGHFNLGSALARQGELEEAAVALREALRLAPGDQRFQDELDSVLGQLASADDRVAELREAIREEPDNPKPVNELAWLFADPAGDATLRDPKKALPLARKAVALSGRREARFLHTLAVALAANGELKEAVAVQEEILKLMSGKDLPDMKFADAEAALERYRKALAAQDQSPKR